jgi:hypothetical protein
MIETEAKIVDNDTLLQAIDEGFKTGDLVNQQLVEFTKDIAKKKIDYQPLGPSAELLA